jgi:hypothetical protein
MIDELERVAGEARTRIEAAASLGELAEARGVGGGERVSTLGLDRRCRSGPTLVHPVGTRGEQSSLGLSQSSATSVFDGHYHGVGSYESPLGRIGRREEPPAGQSTVSVGGARSVASLGSRSKDVLGQRV